MTTSRWSVLRTQCLALTSLTTIGNSCLPEGRPHGYICGCREEAQCGWVQSPCHCLGKIVESRPTTPTKPKTGEGVVGRIHHCECARGVRLQVRGGLLLQTWTDSSEVRRDVAQDSRGEPGASCQRHWCSNGAQTATLPQVQWYVDTFSILLLPH